MRVPHIFFSIIFIHSMFQYCCLSFSTSKYLQRNILFKDKVILNLTPSVVVGLVDSLNNIDEVISSNPTSLNFWSEVYDQSISTFINSFNSRLIGTIVGNLFAGFIFKLLYDKFNDFIQNKNKIDNYKRSNVSFQSRNEPKSQLSNIDFVTWCKLFLCITIDIFGDASFLVPGVGELEDVVWAPISALILRSLFNSDAIGTVYITRKILNNCTIINRIN